MSDDAQQKSNAGLNAMLGTVSALQDTSGLVQTIASDLSLLVPDATVFCCVFRGYPALEIEEACLAAAGEASVLRTGLNDAFASSAMLYDRYAVQYRHQNRWQVAKLSPVDSSLGGYWQTPRHFSRIVVCQGARPLGYISFQDGAPPLNLSAKVKARAKRLAELIRLAAGYPKVIDKEQSAEQFMNGHDGFAVYSHTGELLASTPSVRKLLKEGVLDARHRRVEGPHFVSKASVFESTRGIPFHLLQVRFARSPLVEDTFDANSFATLTPHERRVLKALCETGGSNIELADRLRLRASTVKSSLEQIYQKTGIKGRTKLMARAMQNND